MIANLATLRAKLSIVCFKQKSKLKSYKSIFKAFTFDFFMLLSIYRLSCYLNFKFSFSFSVSVSFDCMHNGSFHILEIFI